MNWIQIALLIYVVGFIATYVAIQIWFRREFKEWTIWDRALALKVSLFSFLSLVLVAIEIISQYVSENEDKPAKW